MIQSMSKPTKSDKTPKSRGTVYNLRLGLEREAILNEYIAQQDVAPDKSAVLLKAFDEFMAKRGLPSAKK